MRPAHCGITPEGWPCIGLTGLSALVFALLDWWFLALVLLALAVVLAGLGSCAEQEEDEKPCKERQPQEKRAADRRKAG